jgi:hypothetical protein
MRQRLGPSNFLQQALADQIERVSQRDDMGNGGGLVAVIAQ